MQPQTIELEAAVDTAHLVANQRRISMRRLIYSMTVSLDGYIAAPDGTIDWSVPDEELFRFHHQQVQEIGVHLCGRRLYETMVYWETAEESPLAGEQVEFAQTWKALPKVVFSTKLESVAGNTRLASNGVGEEVSRLKHEPGNDIAVGGAGLAGACMKLGLIDEWRLFVSPVLLGGGTPYFPPLERGINLELIETRTFGSRVVYLRYRRASDGL
jgi:dihydrofolate reductase